MVDRTLLENAALGIVALLSGAQYCYSECHVFIVMLSVIILSVVMPNVIMLSVIVQFSHILDIYGILWNENLA